VARKLDPLIIKYIDDKLKDNAIAQEAIKKGDARTLMVEAARACVGIKEKTGKNDGPLVESIQKTGGGKKGHSWCMYGVMTWVGYAELKTGKKSPLPNGGHCLTVWRKAPAESRVKGTPGPGAVIIWQHGKTSNGHTGVVLSATDTTLSTVEGNTSGSTKAGGVDRNGNGVYFNKRSRKGSGNMHILGYLKPF